MYGNVIGFGVYEVSPTANTNIATSANAAITFNVPGVKKADIVLGVQPLVTDFGARPIGQGQILSDGQVQVCIQASAADNPLAIATSMVFRITVARAPSVNTNAL